MPFSYLTAKRSLALRLAQIKGTSSGTLESAYIGAWASMLDGSEIPLTAFKDQILSVERELATMIGNNPAHPCRSFLYQRSVDLPNLGGTPTVSNTGVEIVGTWDSIADSATNQPLTFQPTQTLADISNAGYSDTDFFYYNLTGNQLRHTRPLAYLQGCGWDADAQSTAYDADGDSPLPEGLLPVLIDGVTARAAQVGWIDGANTVPYYSGLYQQGIQLFNNTAAAGKPLASTNVVTG